MVDRLNGRVRIQVFAYLQRNTVDLPDPFTAAAGIPFELEDIRRMKGLGLMELIQL